MCEVNVAKFLYSCAKVLGWEAARLKLKHAGKLSLADYYLVALAKLRKATAVTADSSIREVAEAPVALIPL
jgi:predicted nucleic acid-binding protein